MTLQQKMIVMIFSVCILIVVLELIRRKKLREEYAVIWLLTGAVILIIGVFPGIIVAIANYLGFYYLTTVFLVAFLFILVIVLHYSTIISKLTERENKLAQRIAILEMKIKNINKHYLKNETDK